MKLEKLVKNNIVILFLAKDLRKKKHIHIYYIFLIILIIRR